MTNLRYTESIFVARSPETLYDMISDVSRMGDWSPVCTACWWDDGDGPRPGAWFTGRNELPERTWETRSQVVAADRGREFAFVVGGITRFHHRFGDDPAAQIAVRTEAAHQGIPVTLTAIKRAAKAVDA
jgi:hypothetical protein